ncbi:hypothetical protein EVAR_12947_1 [Eumeta japonica]|uniref:Uncharacterized protein n=1 Tax=Eumeta variegata TaxID=151549 RepID=A0A4C1TWA5_EUMVA|nr:hypothetical protein EVAR_12947_1 [Eumeta japonica]
MSTLIATEEYLVSFNSTNLSSDQIFTYKSFTESSWTTLGVPKAYDYPYGRFLKEIVSACEVTGHRHGSDPYTLPGRGAAQKRGGGLV